MSTLPQDETIFADAFRAMAILHGVSGMPEDRYINTFHFRITDQGQSLNSDADDIAAAVRDFYTVQNGGISNVALTNFLSDRAIDQARGIQVRVYDLRDEEPRQAAVFDYALPALSNALALPNEVALVLSYYAERNIPRFRGRLYLGPLNTNTMQQHENDGDQGPTYETRYALRAAAGRLRAAAIGPNWAVYSRKDGELRDITAGWVDNSFDTQRRRGVAPSTREFWPVP